MKSQFFFVNEFCSKWQLRNVSDSQTSRGACRRWPKPPALASTSNIPSLVSGFYLAWKDKLSDDSPFDLCQSSSYVDEQNSVMMYMTYLCRKAPPPLFDSLRRRANARNVSFRISLRWPVHMMTQLIKPNYLIVALVRLFYTTSE